MAVITKVSGLNTVKINLRRATMKQKNGLSAGILRACLLVLEESKKLVPVDYGFLKGSGGVRMRGGNWASGDIKVEGVVMYLQEYAIYVHENPDALHGAAFNAYYAKQLAAHPKTGPFRHNRGANQQYKFLEKPFRMLRGTIRQIIAVSIKQGG